MKISANHDQLTKLMQEMRALKERSGMSLETVKSTELKEMRFEPNTPRVSEDFSQVMKNAIGKVNEIMSEASALKAAHDKGDPGVDLTRTLIASRKAEVAFTATMQVRNKLVEAYKDIMNMQI